MTAVRMAQRTMQGSPIQRWTPQLVAEAPDPNLAFANFTQQVLGVPWPTIKDQTILRSRTAEFFEHYPNATWFTLCRVVTWLKAKRKRVPRVWMVVDKFRDCWVDGMLPELDPAEGDVELEVLIESALTEETDESWRRRLIMTEGPARRAAYDEWVASKRGSCPESQ